MSKIQRVTKFDLHKGYVMNEQFLIRYGVLAHFARVVPDINVSLAIKIAEKTRQAKFLKIMLTLKASLIVFPR